MSSSKIQEYNLDPNMGLAKEESVQEVKTVSDEIKALIGTEIATQLNTLKTDIIAAMPSGSSGLTSCIRKIQRGTATFQDEATSVTLSGFSTLGKMVVIINGLSCYDAYVATPYITSLTTTKLTVNYSGDWNARLNSENYSYQVIEFY